MDIFDIEREYDKDYTAAEIDKDTCINLGDEIYVVSSIGQCPVEYCGIVDEYCFYFKSRGEVWSFSVTESKQISHDIHDEKFQFSCAGRFSHQEGEAGFMPNEQAQALIKSCVALWKQGKEENSE